jgi:hypothetical protein
VKRAVRLAAAVIAAALPAHAYAHSRSVSYSSWEIDGRSARVVVRVALLELTRLPFADPRSLPLAAPLADYFSSRLSLRAGAARCSVVERPRALAAEPGDLVLEWRCACPGDGILSIESALFHEVAPSHLHFARARRGGALAERVLTARDSAWSLGDPAAPARASSLGAYLQLGVEHIFTGYDHLAFLLALLLVAARLGEVATIVTGFTIAHSATLALAALGWVRPDAAAIEALIGLSIALVAAENAWLAAGGARAVPLVVTGALAAAAALAWLGVGAVPGATLAGLALFAACHFALLARVERPVRLRIAVAFLFGLVHGFGFAGVLAGIELPAGRVAAALLGFNAGVEVGQLAVLALLWPVLRTAARWRGGTVHRWALEAGSAAVFALGLFWFVTRAYG